MSETEEILKVAIVEDDNDIRTLLELLIDRSPGFSCKHTFCDAESAVNELVEMEPDVVLMDVELPGISGIEAIEKLKPEMENTDFIILTIRDDTETIFKALRAGADGYLLKDTPPAILLSGIREVAAGGSPMTPSIARKVTDFFKPKRNHDLTQREQEILALLCEGRHYNQIAESLFISGHTVRAHIKNIYRKLQVNSRGEAVNRALKDRLV